MEEKEEEGLKKGEPAAEETRPEKGKGRKAEDDITKDQQLQAALTLLKGVNIFTPTARTK